MVRNVYNLYHYIYMKFEEFFQIKSRSPSTSNLLKKEKCMPKMSLLRGCCHWILNKQAWPLIFLSFSSFPAAGSGWDKQFIPQSLSLFDYFQWFTTPIVFSFLWVCPQTLPEKGKTFGGFLKRKTSPPGTTQRLDNGMKPLVESPILHNSSGVL